MRRKANLITNMHILNNTSCLTHTIKAEISVYSLNLWLTLPSSTCIQLIFHWLFIEYHKKRAVSTVRYYNSDDKRSFYKI